MSEFWSSFLKWFGEKANSPLYWTYFGFFVAWNWKFFQVIFLEHESLFRKPRIEYLESLLFHPTSIEFINWLVNLIWHVGPPAILTYAAIVWLPKIHHWAFEIYTENLFMRKLSFQKRKVQYEEDVATLTKKEATAKKVQATQKKEIEKAKTQEEKWDEELLSFSLVAENIQAFSVAVRAAYETAGEFTPNAQHAGPAQTYIPARDLSRIDTWGIIEISKGGYGQKLALTEKGKYFLRKLQEQKKM